MGLPCLWLCLQKAKNPLRNAPQCGDGSKFTEQKEEMTGVAEHAVGIAKRRPLMTSSRA